jgi:hypothetical protein
MLDGIAASIGPGAFTGVRISVAVAQGWLSAPGLPVVPSPRWRRWLSGDSRGCGSGARLSRRTHGRGVLGMLPGIRCRARLRPAVGPRRRRSPQGSACGFPGPFTGSAAASRLSRCSRRCPGLIERPAHACAARCARHGAIGRRSGSLQAKGWIPPSLAPLYLRDKVALTEAERAAKQIAVILRFRLVMELSQCNAVIAGSKNQGTSTI